MDLADLQSEETLDRVVVYVPFSMLPPVTEDSPFPSKRRAAEIAAQVAVERDLPANLFEKPNFLRRGDAYAVGFLKNAR